MRERKVGCFGLVQEEDDGKDVSEEKPCEMKVWKGVDDARASKRFGGGLGIRWEGIFLLTAVLRFFFFSSRSVWFGVLSLNRNGTC